MTTEQPKPTAQTVTDNRLPSIALLGPLVPGQPVRWTYTPRGGWGIPHTIRARVVRFCRSRVRIAAPLKGGGEEEVTVKPEHLKL